MAFKWSIPNTVLATSVILLLISVVFFALKTPGNHIIMIPENPVEIAITAEQNRSSAESKAVHDVGEAVLKQCGWSEEKLQAGGYDPYAKMNVLVTQEKVQAQAEVDSSVCPDNQ